MPVPVRNIILDLGGVLIDVDYRRTADAFKALGLAHIDDLYTQHRQDSLFDDMDKGLVTNDAFRQAIKKHLPPHVTPQQVDDAWNAMLGRIPPERMALLRDLQQAYRLYLLSNTNHIHVGAFGKIIAEDYGAGALERFFDKIYLSCRLGMRKPEKALFDLVIEENRLAREETLFIDDSIQHVRGAEAAGIPAFHLDLAHDTLAGLLAAIPGLAAARP